MKPFFLALGFFTRLPVPNIEAAEEHYRRAMKLAPLAGLVIGAILVLIQVLLAWLNAPGVIQAAILTFAYIFLTGGLHFDGLADTCDGIFSGKSREQSLEIMKDSRIGVFGTLGLLIAGLCYFAAFTEAVVAALLVFPVVGRACCLVSASVAPFAREGGMGKSTGMEGGAASVASAALSVVGASFLAIPLLMLALRIGRGFYSLLGLRFMLMSRLITYSDLRLGVSCSLIAAGAAVLATVFATMYFKRKLGGVTGDTFGAVIEVSSIVFLIVFVLTWQAFPL